MAGLFDDTADNSEAINKLLRVQQQRGITVEMFGRLWQILRYQHLYPALDISESIVQKIKQQFREWEMHTDHPELKIVLNESDTVIFSLNQHCTMGDRSVGLSIYKKPWGPTEIKPMMSFRRTKKTRNEPTNSEEVLHKCELDLGSYRLILTNFEAPKDTNFKSQMLSDIYEKMKFIDDALFGSAPGTSGSDPGTSGSVPGTSGSAPGTSGSAPGTSESAPGTSESAPGTSGSAPETSGSAPETSGSAPETSGSASGTSGFAPGTYKSFISILSELYNYGNNYVRYEDLFLQEADEQRTIDRFGLQKLLEAELPDKYLNSCATSETCQQLVLHIDKNATGRITFSELKELLTILERLQFNFKEHACKKKGVLRAENMRTALGDIGLALSERSLKMLVLRHLGKNSTLTFGNYVAAVLQLYKLERD